MAFGRTDHRGHTEKGAGLARGPALIVGAILAAFGLLLFLDAGDTPTSGFPNANVEGGTFLGFEANGWTAWFTTCAGALLLFGAAQHLLAKTMSLIVGLALAACVLIAVFTGGDVLGLAATNIWTNLGWAIAAGVLLFNVLSPRLSHKTDDDDVDRSRRTPTTTRDRDVAPPPPPPTTTTGGPSGVGADSGTTRRAGPTG